MSDEEIKKKPAVLITIGRIVHYAAGDREDPYEVHRAAIVTQVHSDECIDLVIFEPDSLRFRKLVMHVGIGAKPGYDAGTWHWPEKDAE